MGIHGGLAIPQGIATRERMFERLAGTPVLVIGTHFAGATAGRIVRDGAAIGWTCEAGGRRKRTPPALAGGGRGSGSCPYSAAATPCRASATVSSFSRGATSRPNSRMFSTVSSWLR